MFTRCLQKTDGVLDSRPHIGREDASAIALRNAKELEYHVNGTTSSPIPVVWGPSGKVRIYYPHVHAERWGNGCDPGPEIFEARVAIPFLRSVWSSYRHMGVGSGYGLRQCRSVICPDTIKEGQFPLDDIMGDGYR